MFGYLVVLIAGRSPGCVTRAAELMDEKRPGLFQSERQALLQLVSMTVGELLGLAEPALLLRRLVREKVALTGGPEHQFSSAGQLETLGYGLLGLLHDGRRNGQQIARAQR